MSGRLRVGILFGGRSGEHEVSVASAASVMAALDPDKYESLPIGITREGRWIPDLDPRRVLTAGAVAEPLLPPASGPDPTTQGMLRLEARGPAPIPTRGQLEVVFPILHGPLGEDGTVQGLLELMDLPYIGAGVMASAVGMDKAMMKVVFGAHGLPIVEHVVVSRRTWEADPTRAAEQAERACGYPCFVKPANLGSSVGVSRAVSRGELLEGMTLAARYDRKIIVERGVDAREIECSVLGNDEPAASVPGEIRPKKAWYDYEAKYTEGLSELIVPAPIPENLAIRAREMAVAAFRAIDCAGMARVDFFLERGTDRLILDEINTIPGFTATSVSAKLWAASGVPYPAVIDRLIALALERHRDRVGLLA